ncbi:uncharacterized protein heatr4 [Trichomycterus rosablanca]|uniref:uncharacterized protein heatr4 n=1 Tax=Trichomycterus rosablanca TaxID=2290929 RepID=UPI002F3531CF
MSQHAANYVYDTDNSELDPYSARMGWLRTEKQEWVYLHIKADVTELGLRPHCSGQETEVPKQPTLYMPMLDLSALRYAVEEWRNAYKIKTSWQSVTTEGLKKALANQHYQVRLAAIAACASIAVNRPQADPDPGKKGLSVS